jgi:hypothetical protein
MSDKEENKTKEIIEVSKDDANFICEECNKFFIKSIHCLRHFKVFHSRRPSISEIRYPSKEELLCKNCNNYNGFNKKSLEEHILKCNIKNELNKDNEYIKQLNNIYKMEDKSEMDEFEDEVKPDEAHYICNECDKLFINIYDIKNHYKMYHCEIYQMPKYRELLYPKKVEINYKCEYCEKQLSNKELLERHLIKCISKTNLIKENEELKRQIKKLELCNNEYKEIITKLLNIQK